MLLPHCRCRPALALMRPCFHRLNSRRLATLSDAAPPPPHTHKPPPCHCCRPCRSLRAQMRAYTGAGRRECATSCHSSGRCAAAAASGHCRPSTPARRLPLGTDCSPACQLSVVLGTVSWPMLEPTQAHAATHPGPNHRLQGPVPSPTTHPLSRRPPRPHNHPPRPSPPPARRSPQSIATRVPMHCLASSWWRASAWAGGPRTHPWSTGG